MVWKEHAISAQFTEHPFEANTLVQSAEAQLQLPMTWHCDDVALLAAANSAELMKCPA